jgi:hypothetical protein
VAESEGPATSRVSFFFPKIEEGDVGISPIPGWARAVIGSQHSAMTSTANQSGARWYVTR